MADLSVIIVNYNSGWFCSNFIDSLYDQEFQTPDGKKGELEIIVVDNDSPDDQREYLEPLEKNGIQVVYSKENNGYAAGNNLGMPYVTSDWLLISNPDVVIMPGSLQRMLDVLYSNSRIGLVGPRGYLDPAFHFFLPPMQRKSLFNHLFESAGRVFKSICRLYARRRARYAMRQWNGSGTIDADGIAGYCFLMPSALARELGPFDEGFPFYYEDDDLSLRVARAGYRSVYVRDTEVIHFYNKSAGPVFDEVLEKYYRSKSYYYQKHYGPLLYPLYWASSRFLMRYIKSLSGAPFEKPKDLGKLTEPPDLELPNGRRLLLELTLDPAFVLSVGHIHDGGAYRMPQETWDALDATKYYFRALDAETLESLMLFKFEKAEGSKQSPSYLELKER
ncbi:MAG: glycosyltransferase family 2 protein [Planctomycetota bacterium]|jgi:GT2 family glycosyltransferase